MNLSIHIKISLTLALLNSNPGASGGQMGRWGGGGGVPYSLIKITGMIFVSLRDVNGRL